MNRQYQTPHALFEWDADKAASNLRKHEISFEQAAEAFADPLALVLHDAAHSHEEDRFHLLGMVNNVLMLLVVFTEKDAIRIISARKATRQERNNYVTHR